MYIRKIILSTLIWGLSLPLLAEECPPEKPLITEERMVCQPENEGTLICATEKVCHSCDELLDLGTTKENCNLCSNRYFVHVGIESDAFVFGNYCTLKECPAGYLKLSDGCRPCNDEEEDIRALSSFKEECEKCPERIFGMGICVLKNKPIKGQFCNDKRSWNDVPKEMCNLCLNRKYVNGECILK